MSDGLSVTQTCLRSCLPFLWFCLQARSAIRRKAHRWPAPLMQPVQVAPNEGGAKGAGNGSAAATMLQQQVQRALTSAMASGAASVHQTADGLTISLHEAGFFGSGTATINPRMLEMLASVAATLPDRDLRVEGHTDNQPIHSGTFRSNWELSTARAAAIAEILMSRSHVSPAHFALAGYGPFRPVTGNDTAAGRAQNRRVDIVLLGTAATSASPSAESPQRPASALAATQGHPAPPGAATEVPSLPFASSPRSLPHPEPAGPRILQLATEADRAAAR